MNITSFNAEVPVGNFKAVRDGKVFDAIPGDVVESPVFYFDDLPDEKLTSKDSNDDILSLISTEKNLLPFPKMRLYLNANSDDRAGGLKGVKFWLHHENGRLSCVFTPIPQDGKLFLEMFVERGKLNCNTLSFHGPATITDPKLFSDRISAFFTSLCWFIREVNSPANFVASVTPGAKGKSVQWQRARTHFVVIHRSHPANKKEVAAGADISIGGAYEARQAHTRRAHSRVLRSPRFKHKIGQTIRIKACWVGPKEWMQSKSIYRVMTDLRGDA